ncbi:MAG: thioredoxin domain-containing protein, partial [Acidobacteriota bacterium]|nr:thioredoxin domain-containing protein [Acidobacteriota bacterium]
MHGSPPTIGWPSLLGGSTVAGIGFTVSLLIAGLAFHGRLLDEAKIGILASAIVAPVIGALTFSLLGRLPMRVWARQAAHTAGEILDLSEDVDPARDHVRGPDDALVTLVEYGDFECPYCGQAESVVRELLTSFGDDLRYVWRHLPLNDVHTRAQLAAEASEAAAAQGRFWDLYDRLLEHQDRLEAPDLPRHADALALDVERFTDELRHHDHAPRIAEDVASADSSGVSGTPSFFINGRRHQGAYDTGTLTAAVRGALTRARLLEAAKAAAHVS